MDLSLVIAIAALVLAVLSPILSSVISGIFHIREKKIELEAERLKRNQIFYAQHRAEVIERYLNVVGKICKSPSSLAREEFGSCMGEIHFYVDRSLWPVLDSIADKVKAGHVEASGLDADFRTLCEALSADSVRAKE